MDALSQLSIVLILLMEVSCLTYLEYRAWHTFYTPLCALMLPYVGVLLVTIAIAGDYGFVRFNYESIYVWILGLPLFAIPSFGFATLLRHYQIPVISHVQDEWKRIPNVLIGIATVLVIALFFKLYNTLSHGFYLFGTDDFAEEFSGHGVWAHMRGMLTPVLILMLYYVRKSQYWMWALIICMFIVQFLYMVKGHIIITIVAALLMRLYAQKMRLSLTFILMIVAGAIFIFFMTYMIIPMLGDDQYASMNQVEFVMRHILHYFTSGTLGWSYDLDQGIPDRNDFDTIITPFLNIANALSGDKIISPINPIYWNTGINYTNVRTFFGTLYIYSDNLEFAVYTLMVSSIIYAIRALAVTTSNVYAYIVHFYYCGLMAMGWFEFYLFHLPVIEIPVVTVLLHILTQGYQTKDEAIV